MPTMSISGPLGHGTTDSLGVAMGRSDCTDGDEAKFPPGEQLPQGESATWYPSGSGKAVTYSDGKKLDAVGPLEDAGGEDDGQGDQIPSGAMALQSYGAWSEAERRIAADS